MSAPFTFRPSGKGWLVKADSPAVEREVATIVGHEVHVEDFPADTTVVGHVSVGNTWIVILKPAARDEFVGALLQRREYGDFDPFRVVAGLDGGEDVAQAIEAAKSLPASSVDAVTPQPGTPSKLFRVANVATYLPLAYAVFLKADLTGRRENYWSYLPRHFLPASFHLARFGALGERNVTAAEITVPVEVTPSAAPDVVDQSILKAHAARLAALEEKIELLASRPPPPRQDDSRLDQYNKRFSSIDDAIKVVDTRISNLAVRLQTQQLAAKAQTEQTTVKPAAGGALVGADASSPADVGTRSENGSAQQSGPMPGTVISARTAAEPKPSPLQRIAPALTVVVSAITAGLIVAITRQDLSSEIGRAADSATRAEAASAQVEALAPEFDVKLAAKVTEVTDAITNAEKNAKRSITTAENDATAAVTTATKAISAAETNAKAAIETAGNTARGAVEGASKTAVELLTKARTAMLACMPLLAKAQVDLATARKQNQRNGINQLEAVIKNAEAKCVPEP